MKRITTCLTACAVLAASYLAPNACCAEIVNANIVVTNFEAFTQTFSLLQTLPVSPIPSPVVIRGSIVGTVTDLTFDDATVSSQGGTPIYTARIDGVDEALLMADPFSASAGGPFLSASVGSEDFGVPIPIPASQTVDSSIAIFLNFDLTAGDSASFEAVFEVISVPEPTTLALAGIGLLGVGCCRRRGR